MTGTETPAFRDRLFTRHSFHYLSLGAAGALFLVTGLDGLVAGDGFGSVVSAAGGLLAATGSGYALANPGQTTVGGGLWVGVLVTLVVALAAVTVL